MTPLEFIWEHRDGRDTEGEHYNHEILVHGSGRILAKVFVVQYYHRAMFYFVAPKATLDTTEAYDFMDVDAAKRFVEETLLKFDPLAPPKPKAARKKRTPSNITA